MLKRLLFLIPLIFVLLFTRTGVEGFLFSSEIGNYNFHKADDKSDDIRSSLAISQEFLSFFEIDEECDEDDVFSGDLRSCKKLFSFYTLVCQQITADGRGLNSARQLYILFHSWKFDLLK
jgi:hypothetical protein